MASTNAVKNVKLIRSEDYGYGFSILGGAGSQLPPIVYDIIEGSPASKSKQLTQGDIIWEINGKEVLSCTTKEVLNYLRLSPTVVDLKLKTDARIQEKLKNFRDNAKNPDVLRTAITQDDLIGISQIVAKKSETTTQSENTSATSTPSLSPLSSSSQKRYDLPRSDTDSFKSFSDNEGISIKSEEKVPINCKGDVQSMSGELTLAFSGTSRDSNSYPSQQRSFTNLRESGSCSMPSSPNDKDRELDSIGRTARPSSGSPQSLCSPLYSSINNYCGSFIYPPTCASVRISKSEDYLQHHKDNMSSVNIELDEDITSSLNTLLDTRDDLPVCSSFTSLNSCAISNHANNDEADLSTVWTVNALHSSSPESCGHSSHDSDSPLIHSLSPVSPQSPTSSMQYSCSGGIYDKIYSGCDSVGSSNRSANVCSNSSSLTSPDTDVPDELEWDDTTPTLSPTNQLVNGFSERSRITNGHSANLSASTDSSISDKISKRLDENRIIIKVAGPGKNSLIVTHTQKNTGKVQRENGTIKCDPDKTPTNTPPQTPGSGTISPETLAYQQLWDSEEEITCLSEKSDDSRNAHKKSASHRAPCASSPPLSEDESDIESLHSFHYSPKAVDMPSVVRLAKRLYLLEGFKKSDVSRHLSKNNEFSKAVAEEYLHYYNFKDDTLDTALRKFLDRFSLAGETQERERVLVHFSKRYLECNPGTFNSQDAVHTLTCAIMLLNTDLHSQNIGRKMTCSEFIDNLAELNDGENFTSEVLKLLYEAIKKRPLKWAMDDESGEGSAVPKGSGRGRNEDNPFIIGSNPFLTTPMGSGVIYKKGYIMRKCCIEPSGKKTAFGKRSWKMWFCVIQDLVMYLHKDEQGARKGPLPHSGQNAVRLHHALANRAHDYAKKEHVFRLQTADQAEYLLQTSDSKELQAWIDAINFVASSLSAPPMPGAVGSQDNFQRPLLPCSITKLNIVDQLEDHAKRLALLESDLENHRDNPPDKSAKSATLANYKEKEVYLATEIRRYQTYVNLLHSRFESSGGSFNIIGTTVSALDINNLPVFEVKSTSAESDNSGKDDPPCVIPPPIPDRPRPGDSLIVNETIQSTENCKDTQTQTKCRKDKKDDEFKKELDKMIKEKEKREKKALKKEEKDQMTLTRRKEKDKQKSSIVEKEGAKDMKPEESKEEDHRIGTMERLRALFKFSKLNRAYQQRETNGNNGTLQKVKNDEIEIAKETADIKVEEFESPPPLPPKPSLGSPVRMIVGTRVDI